MDELIKQLILVAARGLGEHEPLKFRLYGPSCDWAGLGRRHWMLAWADDDGIPRSLAW